LEVYEKVFRIYDCDDFTKKFLTENKVKLNQVEEYIEPAKIDDITNITS